MIPVSILYYEYIDRPKLTKQKKNPSEYIVPPPQVGRKNNWNFKVVIIVKLKPSIPVISLRLKSKNWKVSSLWKVWL